MRVSYGQATAMVEFAKRLCSEAHCEQSDITLRQRAVLQRRERVKYSAEERRNKLEDCKKLMVFLQNCLEVRINFVTCVCLYHLILILSYVLRTIILPKFKQINIGPVMYVGSYMVMYNYYTQWPRVLF